MPETPYPIRPVTADELPAFFALLSTAFGEDFQEAEFEVESLTAEPERTLAAFDGSDIVGTAGAFTFDLSVPGGQLPAAGVTYVGVRPTHRRRGLLGAMMRRQLHEVHERGEPVAVLWASEAAIYGRFGYGVASQLLRIEVDRVDATMRPDVATDDGLRLRMVAPADVAGDIERIERGLLERRPGQFERDKRWIEQLVQDPESRRSGMSKLQGITVHGAADEVIGYALFRTKGEMLRPHMLPDGSVLVIAQAALTPAADVAVTRTLLSLDLMRRIRWWNQPVDTALPHLLTDPRHARTSVVDGVHLRVVDVPAALSGRRYAAPVDVVLEISDPLCPWNEGRWRLRADRDSASCTPAEGAVADLRLGVEALGAAFLGGTSLTTLAQAGRVTAADAETLARTSVAFGWQVAPWCPVIF